jgi:hypothetical protein
MVEATPHLANISGSDAVVRAWTMIFKDGVEKKWYRQEYS